MIIAINTSIKEGPNRLPGIIERHGGNTSDVLKRFFKYEGNPLAYDMWLVAEIQDDELQFSPPDPMPPPTVRRVKKDVEEKKIKKEPTNPRVKKEPLVRFKQEKIKEEKIKADEISTSKIKAEPQGAPYQPTVESGSEQDEEIVRRTYKRNVSVLSNLSLSPQPLLEEILDPGNGNDGLSQDAFTMELRTGKKKNIRRGRN
jgi:hypothetical protein